MQRPQQPGAADEERRRGDSVGLPAHVLPVFAEHLEPEVTLSLL